jgi:hypothetical protein
MKSVTPLLQSGQPRQFLFRGNAVAAAGFLTRMGATKMPLDPNRVTTHGESCLPLAGGVSHSLVQKPALSSPQFISYENCETFVQGGPDGASMMTVLHASASSIRVATSPTPDDGVPNIRSIVFTAGSVSIAARSIHPPEGPPSFQLDTATQLKDLSLVVTQSSGESIATPVQAHLDKSLLAPTTMQNLDDAFLGNREFFEAHEAQFRTAEKLVFGKSRIPRTPEGYAMIPIVNQITIGDQVIQGNVLKRPGFGTISFGVALMDEISRRITMVRIQFGSDPAGETCVCSVETNGIWQ